ncbi:MAG: MoaD/ThiS family protein [Candidatus Hydrogenedentota bacterium]|nr:MAG: MoaD/ThiS family protein [Candidatus Hydrogenedentota bacterium]
MPVIKIPSQLRPQTDGQDSVQVEGSTVGEAVKNLAEKYPALKDRLFDEKGELRRYINIYLGDEDIRFLDNLETSLEENSELALVPAIAGG